MHRKTMFWLPLILLMLGLLCTACEVVEFEEDARFSVRFQYGEWDIDAQLSEEDAAVVKDLLCRKKLLREEPSCVFREEIALIEEGGKTFCIACDACGRLYCPQEERYIALSDRENEILRALLKKYGCIFPCV